ncbi:hypothetical protein TNCV_4802571 [Trichonephila clavipes]|nr:hypothetical protein TNCV_4802571 [Trichonephila clavipes]
MKRYDQKAYKIPPPTPAHTPVAPLLIAIPSTTLAFSQPVIIPEPPVQIPVTPELTTPQPPAQIPDPPVQILLPDPPVVELCSRPLRTTLH